MSVPVVPDAAGTGSVDPTSRTPVIEVRDVSKKVRLLRERNNSLKSTVLRGRRTVAEDFWALRDVSFDVYPGETFGLIGENGSGKSTMLKCLTRILTPDTGTTSVHGKVSALLELGAGFHPELSGRENVFLNGAILGMSQRELRNRFDEIVDFAGIGAFIDEPVKNYSSGMYVRLGFSVAINVDPDVLLVDEVLAVGDEAFQRKCNEKFADLRANGKTIVLVTHSMGSVQNLCDRVAWFEHGRLRGVGSPREMAEQYVGTVQTDREVDDDGHARWGSGEGRITSVGFVDASGRSTAYPRSGEPVTLRIGYDITTPIERPVFGLSVHTLDGHHLTGPNSRDAGAVPDVLEGEGHIDVVFDRLMLLPGTYDISVSLYDYACLHPYDFRQNVLRFDVARGQMREQYGAVSLGGRWTVDGITGGT